MIRQSHSWYVSKGNENRIAKRQLYFRVYCGIICGCCAQPSYRNNLSVCHHMNGLKQRCRDAWLTQLVELATLNLGVMSSSPMLTVDLTLKTVVSIYNRVLFSHEKKEYPAIFDNTDEP